MRQKGATLITVLVFFSIFLVLSSGLLSLAFGQYKFALQNTAKEQALHIAEAGINYYRWHLSHAPTDYQDGTGKPGPYLHDFKDTGGAIIGKFQLEITPPEPCSITVVLKSTGWSLAYPKTKRIIQVQFGRPSLAQYSYLTGGNLWFQEGEIDGRVHANGGIRMDAEQNSLFTSSQAEYWCDADSGCSPGVKKPGIWGKGKGGDSGLWQFPVPAIDFNLITLDLAAMKTAALQKGYYLEPSDAAGYYLKFKKNDTIDVHRVTKLKKAVWGFDGQQWIEESNDFSGAPTYVKTFQLNTEGCNEQNLIFVEDKVWVDGEASQKTTIVAARLPDLPETNASIVVNSSLTYEGSKVGQKIALVAQKNIIIPLYSPDELEIDAVLFAQKGKIIRYLYPDYYSPWHLREEIEISGSLIARDLIRFSWFDENGQVNSGYQRGENHYDADLVENPPPYLPGSGAAMILSWEELK